MKIIHTCFELGVSYDRRVTAMKLSPNYLHNASRALKLTSGASFHVFQSWHIWSSHTQTTELFCYNRQWSWVVSRNLTIVSLFTWLWRPILCNGIPFKAPQHDKWNRFSEVSIAVTSKDFGKNSVWKSLETSCVCSYLCVHHWPSSTRFQRIRL